MINRCLKLIAHPKREGHKIIPLLLSRYAIDKRKVLEKFHNDRLSKPYPDHDKLMAYFPNQNGFFIVAGGNDGYGQDPTYYLERFRGWTGIIIEPLPKAREYCSKNRPDSLILPYALVEKNYPYEKVTLIDCNAMSLIKGRREDELDWIHAGEEKQKIIAKEIEVPSATLDEILDQYFAHNARRDIDLLTIDTEGTELDILKGIDLERYHPKYLLVEIHNESRLKKINDYLADKYRPIDRFCGIDYLYIWNNDHGN